MSDIIEERKQKILGVSLTASLNAWPRGTSDRKNKEPTRTGRAAPQMEVDFGLWRIRSELLKDHLVFMGFPTLTFHKYIFKNLSRSSRRGAVVNESD